jgi:ATP-dependent DNA helicase RecG
MHQNYFNPTPSQVRIYNDRVEFYNPGYSLKEPELFETAGSKLRNPLLAYVFYDLQWAETKGTGLKTTREELRKEGYPLPEYLNDHGNETFTLILPHPVSGVTFEGTDQVNEQVSEQYKNKFFQELMGPIDSMVKVVDFCKEPKSLKEIMSFLNLKHRPTFVKKVLKPLLDRNLLQMTIPGKPNSKYQKYIAVVKEIK